MDLSYETFIEFYDDDKDELNEHGHSFKNCGFCKKNRIKCANFIYYGYDCQYIRPTVNKTFLRSPNICDNNKYDMYKIGPCLYSRPF